MFMLSLCVCLHSIHSINACPWRKIIVKLISHLVTGNTKKFLAVTELIEVMTSTFLATNISYVFCDILINKFDFKGETYYLNFV